MEDHAEADKNLVYTHNCFRYESIISTTLLYRLPTSVNLSMLCSQSSI